MAVTSASRQKISSRSRVSRAWDLALLPDVWRVGRVRTEASDLAHAHAREVGDATDRVDDGVDLEGLDERNDDLQFG